MNFNNISIIGLGYIGLPTAAMFATHKKKVVGVDTNKHAVDIINQGSIHIAETGLETIVHSAVSEGFLKATTIPQAADAFLIAVPTPFKNDYEPDLSYIKSACKSIAPVIKKGDLIILESTSPVGTTEKIAEWLAEARPDLCFPNQGDNVDINIAYCPERVLPGSIIKELVKNDRVIGGLTQKCSERSVELYKIFVEGDCIITNARTAEMAKLTENSFRDVNIAFANELSILCDKLDINVWELIRLANRHPRVQILHPGAGVGGHCIAVDPWFIVHSGGKDAKLIRAAREVNNYKSEWVIEKIKNSALEFEKTHKRNAKIACMGLTFKPDVDDLRESPALYIIQRLISEGIDVLVVEPNIIKHKDFEIVNYQAAVKEADIVTFLVSHKEFKTLNIQSSLDFSGVINS